MAVGEQITRASAVRSWFERRSYDHAQFADIDSLARRKRELDLSLTAILPTREVATTVGPIIDRIHALNERAPLVDQLVVVDADSDDRTAAIARGRGAEVYLEDELVPEFGPAIGKGDAMWRALSVARGDLVLFLDSDTSDFGDQFVYGVVGPLLRFHQLRFVKALYSRPLTDGRQLQLENGARVTELMAKPLLNYFYPQLAGFAQPLAGEVAAPRELLCSIPFRDAYRRPAGRRTRLDGAGRPGPANQPQPVAVRARQDVLRGADRGREQVAAGGQAERDSCGPECAGRGRVPACDPIGGRPEAGARPGGGCRTSADGGGFRGRLPSGGPDASARG